ncbi:MAG: thioredoxin fold domain-containing protein [Thermoprotei archaeon]|nr:thioredoxin fold domain-containing protein [Thermoprotei archaeon]
MMYLAVAEDSELSKIIERMVFETLRKREEIRCCKKAFESEIEIYSVKDLEHLTRTCKVVFINFYSPTCSYCKLFQPIFSYVGAMFKGKAVFAKANVMNVPEIAWQFDIRGTPTTIALIDGNLKAYIPGFVDEETFISIVKDILKKAKCM